ncbi:sensor histidine kinase [Streptomyces sp. NPDC006996]|uniref:sensor histidine kinase n=1 Tax=Streptomyces sp. NPDC006996 TaxID=3156908 RepID=UPI0033D872CE
MDSTRPVTLTGPGRGKPSTAPAIADEAGLRQVVTNLIGNAVTHTPPGTPIRVGFGAVGAHSALEVADQGPGLSPEDRERVFDRFYRTDDSRTRTTGGSSLGLAIAHTLVTAHGEAHRPRHRSRPPARGARFASCCPWPVRSVRRSRPRSALPHDSALRSPFTAGQTPGQALPSCGRRETSLPEEDLAVHPSPHL